MSATGCSGARSYRARLPEATPERVADQVIVGMNFTTAQEAYDAWMGQNPGTGRDFMRLVRDQLRSRGVAVEA